MRPSSVCVPQPPPTQTSCQHDSDCAIAFRDGSCGGHYYGIRSDALAAEPPSCSLSCGPLGCANIDQADDQREVWDRALVAVRCHGGACRTYVTDSTFARLLRHAPSSEVALRLIRSAHEDAAAYTFGDGVDRAEADPETEADLRD